MGTKAADVMISIGEYPVAGEDEYIGRAAELMVEAFSGRNSHWKGYESLFISNGANEYVGYVTMRSLLKAIGLGDPGRGRWKPWYVIRAGKKNNILQIKDLMRPVSANCVNAGDDILHAARAIIENRNNSVLVKDQGRLVGVIRAIDLLWFMEELL